MDLRLIAVVMLTLAVVFGSGVFSALGPIWTIVVVGTVVMWVYTAIRHR